MHGLLTTYLVTVRVRATVEHALDLAPIALRPGLALIIQLLVELGLLLLGLREQRNSEVQLRRKPTADCAALLPPK